MKYSLPPNNTPPYHTTSATERLTLSQYPTPRILKMYNLQDIYFNKLWEIRKEDIRVGFKLALAMSVCNLSISQPFPPVSIFSCLETSSSLILLHYVTNGPSRQTLLLEVVTLCCSSSPSLLSTPTSTDRSWAQGSLFHMFHTTCTKVFSNL